MGRRLDMVREGSLYWPAKLDLMTASGLGIAPASGVGLFFNSAGVPFRIMSYMYAGQDRYRHDDSADGSDIFYAVCQKVGGMVSDPFVCRQLPQFFALPMYFQDSMKEEDLRDLWELYGYYADKGGHVRDYEEYKSLVLSTGMRII